MNDLFDLTGKVAVITGAGGFLMPTICEALIEKGCLVFMTDRHLDRVKEKADMLNKKFGKPVAHAYRMDVVDPASVDNFFKSMVKIDILVNGAARDPKVSKGDEGMTSTIDNEVPQTRLEAMPLEFFKDGLEPMTTGIFLCCQAAIRIMLKNGGGNIINIGSDLSVIAPNQSIYRKDGVEDMFQPMKPCFYSIGKFAVLGATKYIATSYGPCGIRCNQINPSAVDQDFPKDFEQKLLDMIPMKKLSKKSDLKGVTQFLASNASAFINGQSINVDGGKTVW